MDELAAVVGRHDLHAGRQRRRDFLQLLLDAVDDGEGIFAVAHHDDAADHFALAIELGHAAAQIRTEVHGADVLHIDRRAVHDREGNIFDVGEGFDVAAAAHVILGGADLEDFAADVVVRQADLCDDIGERDAVGGEFVWVEIDLVFLDEAADGRDFGHALDGLQRVAQVPVLKAAQFREIVFAALIDKRVFVNPADAGRVGADHGIHALGQRAADGVEIFDHARSRPIDIRPVLEDDVNERFAEHRLAAHELDVGRGDEAGGNRIGDLVLDEVGRAAVPIRVNDHLHVAEIGYGIERRALQRPKPAGEGEDDENENHEPIAGTGFDDALDEGRVERVAFNALSFDRQRSVLRASRSTWRVKGNAPHLCFIVSCHCRFTNPSRRPAPWTRRRPGNSRC